MAACLPKPNRHAGNVVAGITKDLSGPVVGEEMAEREQIDRWHAGDAGLWCMDPIDGTSNFVNGLPYFAVSVA